ncbi:hypothetical protein DFQ04_2218 [Algoriphagus boseongensis]|uniref:Uncharacterized protein n=1 Tax=Algoriphagus boseongensis TaxID=1442587 RepID=A0A4R6T5E4_9BACT|nr:hypothetical protein [Algoriphagus boseongensis]TDQ17563.1 hypothetical protein DFQ04_2218 [Algoriphagus boseongensis]
MKSKIKIITAIILLIYVSILSIYKNDRKEQALYRYKIITDSTDLAPEDFLRVAEIWTKSSARIRTQITLIQENDSLVARAYIDRHNSWLKKDHNIDGALFTHELYHARLAQAIAKDLSKKIDFYGYDKKTSFSKLELYQKKLNYLQGKYDSESNHSRNKLMQAYWEYKIDSLYNLGQHYNISEEVSVFFPTPPKVQVWQFPDDTLYGKNSIVNKLEFTILKLNPIKMDSTYLINYFENIIFTENSKYNTIYLEPETSKSILFGYSKDTVNKIETHNNILVDSQLNFYLARYVFPYFEDQDSTLIKVGERFFDSIKFKSDSNPPKTP